MLFTSFTYLFFFLAFVFPLRWLLPQRAVAPFLLVASYVFYVSWGWQYGFLMAGLTLFTYGVGVALERARTRKKLVVAGAVTVLLLVLGVFKYANFVLSNFPNAPKVDIVLPLGISFYVFEMICYCVDVYRGTPRARSPLTFFPYIAYVPHLVAGPIVRPNELLPQLRAPKRFDGEQAAEGMFIALVGVTKKMVLADAHERLPGARQRRLRGRRSPERAGGEEALGVSGPQRRGAADRGDDRRAVRLPRRLRLRRSVARRVADHRHRVGGSTRGDEATGVATSPPFTLDRPHLRFRLNGASLEGLEAALQVDGVDRLIAQARNAEAMSVVEWDVTPWQGATARFVVRDASAAGHIGVDDVRLCP